ncbi:hypothetical protein M2459_002890 [Parabacteroides sp. PF5-5]|uniref:hypothetical protein n=1 Tax=unclassified Parabacteroides TaxID=2649774 RepID=UPI002475E336|nr:MULTISPECIES: hypothetical protein [unclassified Parabacteroides]MDH6306176.1 hypothetical protein [Parabacteroides sp. PH5-39]MDH6317135.1 hypothetical protein [Parabacteroides sp. PF5-13]MDH6320888.1 hypothetical protein [Parabacteroides sp. PH5-13]MDH6324619.1 hypothetical protein [Parabacteroides sp. PH5-8]MDH6328330.1 hypothetical protein [Parabacteroides sp. PH5-41]
MRRIICFFLFSALTISASAQFQLNRLTFSGGLGLQFGDYTVVNVAPQVGYNFSNYFNAGAGFTYTYYGEKYNNDQWKQTNSYFGMNVYGKFYPIPYAVIMVQPEINRMWQTDKDLRTGVKTRDERMVPVCLVGAGVKLGPMTLMLQYDLAQDDYSPYGNRIFYCVGYTFSFGL